MRHVVKISQIPKLSFPKCSRNVPELYELFATLVPITFIVNCNVVLYLIKGLGE